MWDETRWWRRSLPPRTSLDFLVIKSNKAIANIVKVGTNKTLERRNLNKTLHNIREKKKKVRIIHIKNSQCFYI